MDPIPASAAETYRNPVLKLTKKRDSMLARAFTNPPTAPDPPSQGWTLNDGGAGNTVLGDDPADGMTITSSQIVLDGATTGGTTVTLVVPEAVSTSFVRCSSPRR